VDRPLLQQVLRNVEKVPSQVSRPAGDVKMGSEFWLVTRELGRSVARWGGDNYWGAVPWPCLTCILMLLTGQVLKDLATSFEPEGLMLNLGEAAAMTSRIV
jgi:hypothetical protein